jgi:Arsenical resistance operon protein ArsD
MTPVTVYDPPMRCSTGVCGPEIEPKLVQLAGDLDWLKSRGAEVRRFNLAQEPGRFVENAAVKALLDRSSSDDLLAIVVGGKRVANARYPGRDELAAMAGLADRMLGAEAPKSSCCGGAKVSQEKPSSCC